MVLLAIPCKAGTLRILEDGVVEVLTPSRRVWTLPSTSITRFTAHPGAKQLTLLVYTKQGIYQAEMITPEDFAKLCACFPHLIPKKKRTRRIISSL